ncbi:TPA: hypothetical protein MIU63_11100 [Klebsiella pneumoniae]|nr:hypothetical protein [Klebsiella pneumoniae]
MLILFILLSIWLCRLSEKPGWFKVSHISSMLALEDVHQARGFRSLLEEESKFPRMAVVKMSFQPSNVQFDRYKRGRISHCSKVPYHLCELNLHLPQLHKLES